MSKKLLTKNDLLHHVDWSVALENVNIGIDLLDELESFITEDGWNDISMSPYITPDIIDKYSDKLNWDLLCQTPGIIPLELLCKYDHLLGMCMSTVVVKQKIDAEFVISHNDMLNSVDIERIFIHQQFNEFDLQELLKRLTYIPWEIVSQYQNLSHSIITTYSNVLHWSIMSIHQVFEPNTMTTFHSQISDNRKRLYKQGGVSYNKAFSNLKLTGEFAHHMIKFVSLYGADRIVEWNDILKSNIFDSDNIGKLYTKAIEYLDE